MRADVWPCCGGKKSWSRNTHKDGCRYARRASKLAHPSQTAITTNCTAHPSEDRWTCQPCESLSDEWRERPRIGDRA